MRKLLAGTIIAFSAALLLLSAAGIGAAWGFNGPVTRVTVQRLTALDAELDRTQTALRDTKVELERALRIIGAAGETLTALKDELARAKELLGSVDVSLEGTVIPGLQTSREKLDALRVMLENLRNTLQQLNNLPFIDLNVPGEELLNEIISGINVFNAELANIGALVERASTSLEDITYLMGGDTTESELHLQSMLLVVTQYEERVTGWREDVQLATTQSPRWIDLAALVLTLMLLWFGFSQFALMLFGLTLWQGGDPLFALRTEIARHEGLGRIRLL